MNSTRSNDGLLRLARMYVEMGFTFIPFDEAVNFNDSDRTRLLRMMNASWQEKETLARIAGTPFNKFTREPVVGRLVGRDYINLVKEYEGNFGKKKVTPKKAVQARKTSSAAQKKSRSEAKKAMNMMWKEGITLKQAWKKVKSGKSGKPVKPGKKKYSRFGGKMVTFNAIDSKERASPYPFSKTKPTKSYVRRNEQTLRDSTLRALRNAEEYKSEVYTNLSDGATY